MRRYWLGLAAASVLSACGGGNPFITTTDDPTDDPATTIPEALANDLESVDYDPGNQTLTVTGVGLDETPFTATYVRKPALDRNGYEAYAVQDNALTEHSTAYVRQTEGGYAAVVVTGGQFGTYQGGTTYGRTGSFTAPVTDAGVGGIVSYAGTYVGLLNINGDGGDLLTPAPGTDPSILPGQSAEVTGDVFINADFTQDSEVKGRIYNRRITDLPATAVEDLTLMTTAITSDGSFTGAVNAGGTSVGDYGGVFSGADAAAVAGSVHATSHIEAFSGNTPPIEEYGVFVLGSCDGASPDPVCNQPDP
ncbi:thymidylate synthase [Leisingera sp. M658]|uniref:thymidylate synthase n=1 Tax=Leisingera sp. M658 TaxID=2867015 RepID=UPI0021A66681|nr:thymidylate synthase [Leisingera sp. M658]UWQ76217.1 thymidylate synthase [Leisingera sp. M658]